MTNKEALLSMIPFEVNDTLVEKKLLDSGLSGVANYTAADEKEVDLCCVALLDHVIAMPDESEGKWSLKIDKVQLFRLKNSLLRKHGLSGGPKIDCETIW